jgi:hypothetical protein
MVGDNLYPVPGAIAVLLASHGLYKGSLSRSGAIAAFLVGYGHLANPLKLFGVSMIGFYLLGSRATKVRCEPQLQESPPCTAWTSWRGLKVKADIKAKLEDGPDPSKPGGNRDAVQVSDRSA